MNKSPEHTSNDLFERWKEGSDIAFERLFNRLFPPLLKFASKTLHDDGKAEELVMDVFFRIWSKKDTISIDGNIEQYLYKCVRYAVIDHYRKKQPAFSVITAADTENYLQPSCDEKLISNELEQECAAAINRLSPRRKEVYQLSRDNGMSYREIASHTGLSINTVENHMMAALQFLKSHLKKADVIISLLISLILFF